MEERSTFIKSDTFSHLIGKSALLTFSYYVTDKVPKICFNRPRCKSVLSDIETKTQFTMLAIKF